MPERNRNLRAFAFGAGAVLAAGAAAFGGVAAAVGGWLAQPLFALLLRGRDAPFAWADLFALAQRWAVALLVAGLLLAWPLASLVFRPSLGGVFGLSAGAKMDGGAAAVAQFQVASDEIRVEMREEDVADGEAVGSRIGQVLLNVPLGVDNDGGGGGLVGEEVGGMGKAAQVVLFQEHGCEKLLAKRLRRSRGKPAMRRVSLCR